MPPKRSSHRPPPPPIVRAAPQQAEVWGGSLQARMKKLEKDIKECRKLNDAINRSLKDRYLYMNGALCEINPGTFALCPHIVTELCFSHKNLTEPTQPKEILKLEKDMDRIKTNMLEKHGTAASREVDLQAGEGLAMALLRDQATITNLLSGNTVNIQRHIEVPLELLRSKTYPVVPPPTPAQRANAMTHTNFKSLPSSYIDLLCSAVSQRGNNAEIKLLESATKLVPGCHIAWRLLALLLFENPPQKKKLSERIVERLVPMSYYAKVVQILPKDVSTWWNVAKQLFSLEEEFIGDESLRSLIHVTINNKKYSSWDCFARVLELEPNVAVYWLHLGKSMLRAHHPFAKEECLVNIAFEGGPMMTEVSARYCYEAYLRINPDLSTNFMPWLDVARAMLNERDVTADVDDAFTSIEIDNGATTLTRPDVLVKMLSVDPTNPEMWLFLFRTFAAEPDSYRLSLRGMSIPGIDTDITLTQRDCLVRAIELNPKQGWVMLYDYLLRRESLRVSLHVAAPHMAESDSDDESFQKLPSCEIFGKKYTSMDCLIKSYQVSGLAKRNGATSQKEGLTSYDQSVYNTWLIIASEGCVSVNGSVELPLGPEALPLRSSGVFINATEHCTFAKALTNVLLEFTGWSCDIRLRLLQLLRNFSTAMLQFWPDAGLLFDSLQEFCICHQGCPTCHVVMAMCIKLSSRKVSLNAHSEYLRAHFHVSANLDPESWHELGKCLEPREKITLYSNDETSKEYTRVDCFKQAIESPKRWNRAETWLALCSILKRGETVDIYGKPHTSEDCLKQSRLWCDERPNDQLMSQLTLRARAAHDPHYHRFEVVEMKGSEDGSSEEESSDIEESDEANEDTAAVSGGATEGTNKKKTDVDFNDGGNDDDAQITVPSAPDHTADDETLVDIIVRDKEGSVASGISVATATICAHHDSSAEGCCCAEKANAPTKQPLTQQQLHEVSPIQEESNEAFVASQCMKDNHDASSSTLREPIYGEDDEPPFTPSKEVLPSDRQDHITTTTNFDSSCYDVNTASASSEKQQSSEAQDDEILKDNVISLQPDNGITLALDGQLHRAATPATTMSTNIVPTRDAAAVEEHAAYSDKLPATGTSCTTSTNLSSSSAPILAAPAVRSTWSALMAIEGGLNVLKTLSQGGGINQ